MNYSTVPSNSISSQGGWVSPTDTSEAAVKYLLSHPHRSCRPAKTLMEDTNMHFSTPEYSPAFEHCSVTVIGDTAGIPLLLAADMHIQKQPISKPISSPRIDFQVLDSDAGCPVIFFPPCPQPHFQSGVWKKGGE